MQVVKNKDIQTISSPYEIIKQSILNKYNIQDVQVEVVRIFLQQFEIDIKHIKNKLISDFLSSKNEEVYKEIKNLNIKWKFSDLEPIFYLEFSQETINANGIVYTPYYIANYINEKIMKDAHSESNIIDLSCGSGIFLLSAINVLRKKFPHLNIIDIIENNIYGVDILQQNVFNTKILLSIYALISNEDKHHIHFNILCGDILELNIFDKFKLSNIQDGFDYVVGNPPYVKIQNLSPTQKNSLKTNFFSCQSGNYNLFYAFIELSLKIIKLSGKIGYIVPNHLLKMKSAQNLRKILIDNQFISIIIDFKDHQVFNDIQTYSSIIFLDLDKKNTLYYNQVPNNLSERSLEDYLKHVSFNTLDYKDISFETINLLSDKELENIKKIESQPYSLKISTGIATQKDNLYIIKLDKEINHLDNDSYFFKEFNGSIFPIEKEITIPIIRGSGTRRIDSNSNFYDLNRIIYPYESIDGKIKVINEFKLKIDYPKTFNYFIAIRDELNKRNGGKPTTQVWYEYGRAQALGSFVPKIIFPTNSSKPNFVYFDIKALFHNGYAIYGINQTDSKITLPILSKILNSFIMDYYIKLTSYMISGGYYCYQKKYVENFRIPKFTESEINFLNKTDDSKEINNFLIKKYQLTF